MKAPPPGINCERHLWNEQPVEFRREATRTYFELTTGIAGLKDKRLGRPQKALDGFYGLQLAEYHLWRMQANGAKADALNAARADVERLKTALASDEAKLADIDFIVETYTPVAEAAGLTLRQWIQQFVDIENALRADPLSGLLMICDKYGWDLLDVLRQLAAKKH